MITKYLPVPKRVEDLTGKTINNFLVLGYVGRNNTKTPKPIWEVKCRCTRVVHMTRSCIIKNTSGCGSCLNSMQEVGNYLKVDVSTEKHKSTFTLVDREMAYLFRSVRWYAYIRGNGGGVYVRTNSTYFESSELHRVINKTPANYITDHISGNTLDNRSINLRTTNTQGNQRNCKRGKNNTTGYLGVSVTPKGKYRAYININRQQVHLGHFIILEEAVAARKEAEILYGFHENHGREQNS